MFESLSLAERSIEKRDLLMMSVRLVNQQAEEHYYKFIRSVSQLIILHGVDQIDGVRKYLFGDDVSFFPDFIHHIANHLELGLKRDDLLEARTALQEALDKIKSHVFYRSSFPSTFPAAPEDIARAALMVTPETPIRRAVANVPVLPLFKSSASVPPSAGPSLVPSPIIVPGPSKKRKAVSSGDTPKAKRSLTELNADVDDEDEARVAEDVASSGGEETAHE